MAKHSRSNGTPLKSLKDGHNQAEAHFRAAVDQTQRILEARGRSDEATIAEMRAASTILFERSQFAERAGLTFMDSATGRPLRDLYKSLGYQRVLLPNDYLDRYYRGGIAERLVEAYPNATWVAGSTVIEDEDPDTETPFEKEVREFDERLGFWSVLLRADYLANIGRYSGLLIGAPGDFQEPIVGEGAIKLKSIEDVLYLTPIDEARCLIMEYDSNTDSERFGLPLYYTVNFGVSPQAMTVGPSAGITKKVHWSRIIHVADGLLRDSVFGRPRMRAIWNYLDDLDKIVGGGAEAAWRRMDPGLHVNLDKDMHVPAAKLKDLSDQIEEYRHELRRTLMTRGTEVTPLSGGVSDIKGNVDAIVQMISSTTGIPQRILLGSERGSLASTQDRDNWNDRVSERRQRFAKPLVLTFMRRLIDAGALDEPKQMDISWSEEEEMGEEQKAAAVSSIASANASMMNAGGGLIMTANEIRDQILGLDPLPHEDQYPPESQPTATTPPDTSSPTNPQDVGAPPSPPTGTPEAKKKGDVPPQLKAAKLRYARAKRAAEADRTQVAVNKMAAMLRAAIEKGDTATARLLMEMAK